jgi:uncharacterized protein YecT (DUF1311 family)
MRNQIPFLTALIIAAAMPGSVAFAADDDKPTLAADTETITACLAAARKANQGGRDCIGRVSNPCIDKNGSTIGMAQCMNDEMAVWDKLLNSEYKRLLGALDPKDAETVRKAQRAWIVSRDADCKATDDISGGTISIINSASCLLGATGERVVQLRSWWDMAHPEEMNDTQGADPEGAAPPAPTP